MFHEVNGLSFKAVRQSLSDESLVGIVLDFESKALIMQANGEDDTVDLCELLPKIRTFLTTNL